MEKTINITVKDKTATAARGAMYICGNSDFTAVFSFDSEWDAYDTKTARFKANNGTYTDVIFSGNECAVPIISNTSTIQIGVYAGNLSTTTPAFVMAKKSILCGAGAPADPAPDVYNQLMDRFNEIETPSHEELTNRDAADQHPISAITGLVEALEAASGGGSTATPDWAENDETAAGYIANRTHWTADDGTIHELDSKYIPLCDSGNVGGIKVTAQTYEELNEKWYHNLIFRNTLDDHLYTVRTDTIQYTELSPDNLKEMINTLTLNTNALFTDSLGDDYSDTVLNRLQFPVHAWYYGTNYNTSGYPALVLFESADGLKIMAQILRGTGAPLELMTQVVEASEPPDLSGYVKTEDIQPGHMRINITSDDGETYTADKTFAEILAHIEAGGSASAFFKDCLEVPLYYKDNERVVFGIYEFPATASIMIESDDTATVQIGKLTADDLGAIPAPETAEVGQVIAVKAVDGSGKPTEWEAVDISGGGGTKEWAKLVDYEFDETNTVGNIELTGLDNLTEFYFKGFKLTHAGISEGGYHLYINGTKVVDARHLLRIGKSGTALTQWAAALYNGIDWRAFRSPARSDTATTMSYLATTSYCPSGVGTATTLELNAEYTPTGGTLEVWGR